MGQFDRSACFSLSAIDNCDLNFIANQNYPLLYHVGTFENDLVISVAQFCVIQSRARLLQFMADALKSNLRLVIPKEQFSGDLNDQKEWTGMMRLFSDKKIDFAFNDFSFQTERQTVVKYSVPIDVNHRFAILSRKTFVRPEFSVYSIFDLYIWLLMLLFFILCLLVIFFVFKIGDIGKVAFDFMGIFLGLGTVIDPAHTYIPRVILALWTMGTLIFTFILRNEILALYSARTLDKIDSVEDIKARNLKVYVQNDNYNKRRLLARLDHRNVEPIKWAKFWSVETKNNILSGSHVLVFNEDKLEVMASDPEYSFRISDEKKDMRFGFYLFRVDINVTVMRKVNKCIKAMTETGIYMFLKVNAFREYVTADKNLYKKLARHGDRKRRRQSVDRADRRKARNLHLTDIVNSFHGLFYGWIASYVLLLGELLLDRVRSNMRRTSRW